KSKDNWWSADGKKLNSDNVDLLASSLRDLQAEKFAESGLGKPAITIAVASGDGKRLEKVLIARAANGKDYVAQRENEPSLYMLKEDSVSGLLKAADTAKAPAESKK